MKYASFDELPEYEPTGHDGVINRLLVGAANWGVDVASIWHGNLAPGGHADLHIHPGSIQVYVGMSGTMIVGDGRREETLERLGTVMFDAGETHFIANRSDRDAEVLVVSVPGLR